VTFEGQADDLLVLAPFARQRVVAALQADDVMLAPSRGCSWGSAATTARMNLYASLSDRTGLQKAGVRVRSGPGNWQAASPPASSPPAFPGLPSARVGLHFEAVVPALPQLHREMGSNDIICLEVRLQHADARMGQDQEGRPA